MWSDVVERGEVYRRYGRLYANTSERVWWRFRYAMNRGVTGPVSPAILCEMCDRTTESKHRRRATGRDRRERRMWRVCGVCSSYVAFVARARRCGAGEPVRRGPACGVGSKYSDLCRRPAIPCVCERKARCSGRCPISGTVDVLLQKIYLLCGSGDITVGLV